jgi:hypothetical protein
LRSLHSGNANITISLHLYTLFFIASYTFFIHSTFTHLCVVLGGEQRVEEPAVLPTRTRRKSHANFTLHLSIQVLSWAAINVSKSRQCYLPALDVELPMATTHTRMGAVLLPYVRMLRFLTQLPPALASIREFDARIVFDRCGVQTRFM